jgi:hypothetical protein
MSATVGELNVKVGLQLAQLETQFAELNAKVRKNNGAMRSQFSTLKRDINKELGGIGADFANVFARRFGVKEIIKGAMMGVGIGSIDQVMGFVGETWRESAENAKNILESMQKVGEIHRKMADMNRTPGMKYALAEMDAKQERSALALMQKSAAEMRTSSERSLNFASAFLLNREAGRMDVETAGQLLKSNEADLRALELKKELTAQEKDSAEKKLSAEKASAAEIAKIQEDSIKQRLADEKRYNEEISREEKDAREVEMDAIKTESQRRDATQTQLGRYSGGLHDTDGSPAVGLSLATGKQIESVRMREVTALEMLTRQMERLVGMGGFGLTP